MSGRSVEIDMTKRYLVFAFNDYYSSGGWTDFVSAHDGLDDATRAATHAVRGDPDPWRNRDNAHVVDLHTLEVIWHVAKYPRQPQTGSAEA